MPRCAGDTLIHPENGQETNTYVSYKIRKGDMEAGWAAADVVIEGTYEVPYQEHAYLQPEAGMSYVDDAGRITVEIGGPMDPRGSRTDRPCAGSAPGGGAGHLPGHRRRLRRPRRYDAADRAGARRLAAQPARRASSGHVPMEPRRVDHRSSQAPPWTNSRQVGRNPRRPDHCRRSRRWLDAGGYNYTTNKVLGNLHLSVAGCYEVPNARIDSHGVYTNAAIGGAFRGFGGPQGAFVAETQINKLAAAIRLDPIELRRRNTLREGSIGITQTPMPAGVTLPEVIEACAQRVDFAAPPSAVSMSPMATLAADEAALRRGRGFACAFKNVGFSFGFPERCEAELHLYPGDDDTIGRVELFHGAADVGQGSHQALLQMAADAVGVALDRVEGHFSDTAISGDSGSVSASRMTWMAGNSILGAAEEAEKRWREGDRPAVGRFRFVPPPTEALDPETGVSVPNFTYGYVAQAVEIAVEIETGHIVVDRVVSAHDVGRAINPAQVVGQIEGCVVQAHGYALSEDLQVRDGHITNPRLSSYLIPGIGDVPRLIESVILELGDPLGPWGARGMAEMPFMTYAPAVVAALHDATGVWFDQFPLTPSRVLAGLR